MNTESGEYIKKVWDFLDRMECEKRYTIANLAIPENRARFIEIVKAYMDSMPYQGGVSFNSDFTKLYKNAYPDATGKIPGFVYGGQIYEGEKSCWLKVESLK